MYLYVCNSDFLKVTKKTVLVNAVQAQYNNYSNSIVSDFLIKALFTIYIYILHDLLTLNAIVACSRLIEDKSACNRSPCDMKLGSIQQVQLLQK